MKGRKADLKAIEGGLSGVPRRPDEVHESMQAEWDIVAADMVERRILVPAMMGVLSTYMIALRNVRECQKALDKHGHLVETAHKMLKPNPAAGQMSKYMETVARLSAELGLTPAARSKQGFGRGEKPKDSGAPDGLDL